MPASSLGIPLAIATQNRCWCSRLATGGRPGVKLILSPPPIEDIVALEHGNPQDS